MKDRKRKIIYDEVWKDGITFKKMGMPLKKEVKKDGVLQKKVQKA